ncbi:MAG: HAD hydrolase family protein [Candidatus Saccharimonadales bacterium]
MKAAEVSLQPNFANPNYDPSMTLYVRHAIFDVDNTLVGNNSQNPPDKQFIAESERVAAGGGSVSIATARPLQKVEEILGAVPAHLAILSNGAQIFNPRNGEMIDEQIIPRQVAMDIVRTLQAVGVFHWVQDDGVDHFVSPTNRSGATTKSRESSFGLGEYVMPKNLWLPAESNNQLIVPSYAPQKPLVIVAKGIQTQDVPAMLDITRQYEAQDIKALEAHRVQQSDGSFLHEIFYVRSGANKKDALQKYLEITQFKHEQTLGVGDGPNDGVLLEAAHVGVAVENAVPETKEKALFIAPSWNKFGAAVALSALIR